MTESGTNFSRWIVRARYSAWSQYLGAAIAVWVALSLWTFSPILHRHLFPLLLAAVLVSARFLGFGPAVFSSLIATACLDFFALPPYFAFRISTSTEGERLLAFLAISMFASSMARQKTLAESRAERSTREMAAIVEYSCDAIFSTDKIGNITSWNRAAERLYGYSAEEAAGMSVMQLAPPERLEEVRHNGEILNSGGQVVSYQTERIRKDGTRWPVLLSVSPLLNRRGQVVGGSVIARDISVEKQSEEAVRRSEKLATAGRLAASIAHEINNPLEAVLNLLYLARHDSGHAGNYLNLAEQEVGRVARLAQQTLGFVRDASSPSSMNPVTIVDEILELYSRKLEGRRINVLRRYRGTPQIAGYSGEVRQLLANLLVNAVDAMADGGSLYIRVAVAHDRTNHREGVRITVADNGAGIHHDNLRQIFEPFYTTKKETGTGLGLWVSRGIVQKHGGSIRVRSRTGGAITGTVFSVFLPERLEISRVA
jgi:PAS domain S-box-containing protein